MRRQRTPRRGSALVITVGLLAVLAVAGFGFAVVMRLHYNTSRYYRASSDVELLSRAVMYYAIHEIRDGTTNARPRDYTGTGLTGLRNGLPILESIRVGALHEPTDSVMCPWYVDNSLAVTLLEDSAGTLRYYPLRAQSYARVHDVLGNRVALTYVRVLDAASKINVNDDNASLFAANGVLDYLFEELEINTGAASTLTGAAIGTYRDGLPGKRFTTLRQLAEKSTSGAPRIVGMTERRFDVLKHYLTIYSWPHEPVSHQGFTPGTITPDGSGGLNHHPDSRRSPININTAPFEVLVAIFASVRVPGGGSIGLVKARRVASWIIRRRDPENPDHWREIAPGDQWNLGTWRSWLQDAGYGRYIRNPRSGQYYLTAYRNYALGLFDSWNEVMATLHGLTDPAGNAVTGSDPFPDIIDRDEAEAILAAVNPNATASFVPHDASHMSYTRMSQYWSGVSPIGFVDQQPRDNQAQSANPEIMPEPTGKNDLGATGFGAEFCFHARGRFEITSVTRAFLKADYGEAKTATATDPSRHYILYDDSNPRKAWDTAPAQWRGYSVLIYHGLGKGQLRAIVANTSNSLTVAKWSTNPDDTSRYYICGPGPMLDRVDMNDAGASLGRIDVTNNDSFLVDRDATWEDDQWNGYRVVVYRAGYTTETIPDPSSSTGTKTIANERIAEATVQERTIVDTEGGGTPHLVLSPKLADISSGAGYHWSYIILGSYGSATHEAAVKAYDVIHHTTEKDFQPSDHSPGADISVGPNPPGVDPAEEAGYITVAREPVTAAASYFLYNPRTGLAPDRGGRRVGGDVAVGNVFSGGALFHDGLYIRLGGTGQYVAYSVDDPIVTDSNSNGGFVSLWFRPDPECMRGPLRTIIRIKGKGPTGGGSDFDDIRLVMEGKMVGGLLRPHLKLIVRAQGQEFYDRLMGKKTTGGPTELIDVYCQKKTQTVAEIDVSTRPGPSYSIPAPWQAGEWHHIAFAWFESYPASPLNDDGNVTTDSRCDGPVGAPKYDELDTNQVKARLILWIDGIRVRSYYEIDAFNLMPETGDPSGSGVLHIGEKGYPPAGTVDGIVAHAHTSKTLGLNQWPGMPRARYKGYPISAASYRIYKSPTITLPAHQQRIYLGTVACTLHTPYIYRNNSRGTSWALGGKQSFPAAISVTLAGRDASLYVPNYINPPSIYYNNNPLGCGGPLRTADSSATTISGTGASLFYEIAIQAGHGLKGYDKLLTRYVNQPAFSQSTVIEDVTITYLGPVVLYHWR